MLQRLRSKLPKKLRLRNNMSKKVHPYAHRIGILRGWKSRWFSDDRTKYRDMLIADVKIREFIKKKLRAAFVSEVEIERSEKATRVIIRTSRPGMIIGRGGDGAKQLRADLLKMMSKSDIVKPEDLKIDIQEVKNPDSDAQLIAMSVVEGLERRMPFRRVIKQTLDKVMAVRGVQGARIVVAGRLNGAEMARTESVKRGSIPLQTFRADIDFARERAKLYYGTLGIKVWIYKGQKFENESNKK
jgi:small subunit ribosomal protein S3